MIIAKVITITEYAAVKKDWKVKPAYKYQQLDVGSWNLGEKPDFRIITG